MERQVYSDLTIWLSEMELLCDVTFIAITGFAQPTSLQRWPPFGLIHLLKRVRIHVNVSLNGFQRPLRIYLSPQRSYCCYDSCTKNDITNFIFMRYEGLWSNSLALLHWITDRIRLYEKFIILHFNRTDHPKNTSSVIYSKILSVPHRKPSYDFKILSNKLYYHK